MSASSEGNIFVVILNWNGKDVIEACINSLLRIPDPGFEIIVVDNASSDGSDEIIEKKYPHVELIKNDTNLLFARGNNIGITRAIERGADYILLLNNDTEVDPEFLRNMLSAIKSDSKVGIVGPKILYFDDKKRVWYGGGSFYPLIWIPKHDNIRKLDGTFEEKRSQTGYVTGCAMLIRREVVEEIGLLDPSYTIYCEDVDFCLRARRAGWSCVYEPSARVYHKVSFSSGGGLTPFKLENRIHSTFLLHKRFKPVWWRIALFPIHFIAFSIMMLLFVISGRWKLISPALKGVIRVLKSD